MTINLNDHYAAIKAGFGNTGSREFVSKVSAGNTLHRGICIDDNRLSELAEKGQHDVLYSLIGSPSLSLDALCKLGPAQAFSTTCSSLLVLPTDDNNLAAEGSMSVQAGIAYSRFGLNVRRFRIGGSDNDPILPYILKMDRFGNAVKSTGPFMDLYRPHWDQALQPLFENRLYQRAPISEKFRLTAMELVQISATNIDNMLRAAMASLDEPYDCSVVPYFYDSHDDQLIQYYAAQPGAPHQQYRTAENVLGNRRLEQKPNYFVCSCCDSRGLLRYAFGAQPGQIHEMNTIGGIIPDYHTILQHNQPNSTLLQIEVALANGCTNFGASTHYKCGGLEGLVTWCLTGEAPHNPYIRQHLRQDKAMGDKIIDYARANNFADDKEKLCRVTEMHIARLNGRNAKTLVGVNSNVLTGYFDTRKRKFHPLPFTKLNLSDDDNIAETVEMFNLWKGKRNRLPTVAQFYRELAKPKRAELNSMLNDPPPLRCVAT